MAVDAVLIVGHGSRVAEANTPLVEIARLVAERLRGCEAAYAFLQFASPSLTEAVEGLVTRGRKRIAVVPFFLYPGAHVREDIPREIEALKKSYPGVELFLTDHLGVDPLMADIVAARVADAEKEKR